MKNKLLTITIALIFLISIGFASALIVDADYATMYAGESKTISIDVENNHAFDIEDVSIQLMLSIVLPDGTPVSLPFTVIGSSEKTLDDLDDDDDDSASFTIKVSTDIIPGDYNIPYHISYVNADDTNEEFEKTGTFGLRVSAKTDLDFTIETRETPVVGQEGKISLEIINKGLGEIKSVQVEIFPEGFELISKSKIFIGTIDADDTDLASFDILYKETNPTLNTKITYKDFDNEEHTENVNLPFSVYTKEEALEKGIIKKNNIGLYITILVILIIIWVIYRKFKKAKRNKRINGK